MFGTKESKLLRNFNSTSSIIVFPSVGRVRNASNESEHVLIQKFLDFDRALRNA